MKFHGNRMDPKHYSLGQVKFLIILIPLALFFGLPLLYIFSTAFKPMEELFAFPPQFFVRNPTLDNFRGITGMMSTSSVPFLRYILNSIVSTAVVVAVSIAITLSAGYTLAKKRFRAKNALIIINTMSMMFVPVAVTIPRYLVMNTLNLTNTFFALVLPLIAMPVGLFLMVQVIQDLPDSLFDSARIDGAGELKILTKIVAPMVKPAIATVAILAFQVSWNAIEPSSYFINNDSMRTFPYFVATLAANSGNAVAGAGMSAAATLLLFIPNFIIFIVMQSRVMNTMAHSGIK